MKSKLDLKSNKNYEFFMQKVFAIDYSCKKIIKWQSSFSNNDDFVKEFFTEEEFRVGCLNEFKTIGEAIIKLTSNKECNKILNDYIDSSFWNTLKEVRSEIVHSYDDSFESNKSYLKTIIIATKLIPDFIDYLNSSYSNFDLKKYYDLRNKNLADYPNKLNSDSLADINKKISEQLDEIKKQKKSHVDF